MKTLRLLLPFFALAVAAAQTSFAPAPALTLPLREGWTLQSSAKVAASGEVISSASFHVADWIEADVPTTVVAAQVKRGLLPDPFYGTNIRKYPGVSYPIGTNFSNIPMPPTALMGFVVVSQRVHVAGRFLGENCVAEFPGDQLSRQYFS